MSSTVSSGPVPNQEPNDEPNEAPERDAVERGQNGGSIRLSPWTIGYLVSAGVLLFGSVLPLWPGGQNVWTLAGLFLVGVGVVAPLTAAGFLVASDARGAGDGGPHLGSLNAAQVAHVASWLAFAQFFLLSVTTLNPIALIGLAGSIGLLVCSPLRFLVDGLTRSDASRNVTSGSAGADELADAEVEDDSARPETPEDIQASWRSGQGGWQAAGASGWHTASGRAGGAVAGGAEGAVAGGAETTAGPDGGWETPAYASPRSSGGAEAPLEREIEPHEETVVRSEVLGGDADADTGGTETADSHTADPDAELGLTRLTDRSTESSRTAGPDAPNTAHQVSSTREGGGSTDVGNDWIDPRADDSVRADTYERAGAHAYAGALEERTESVEQAEQADTPRGAEAAQYEAFWFAVGTRRHAVTPEGRPAFVLEPGGWILALEDRGHEFLVQNTDGRTGLLRELQDIERA